MKHSKLNAPKSPRKAAILLAAGLVFAPLAFAAPAQAATTLAGGYCSKTITYVGAGGSVYGVPGDSSNNIECRMEQGASSNAVRALQSGLNGSCAVRAGLTVDGQFGAATRAALIRAQQKFGVTADGIYGPNTAHAFKWTTSNGSCASA